MATLKDDGIKIINTGGHLVATMPNGDVIPMQVTMIIEDELSMRYGNYTNVTITLKSAIPTEEFEILKRTKIEPI